MGAGFNDGVDDIERRVRQLVADVGTLHGLDHEIVACDPDLADTAAFVEAYGYAM
jgi:hypothetical protein